MRRAIGSTHLLFTLGRRIIYQQVYDNVACAGLEEDGHVKVCSDNCIKRLLHFSPTAGN